eukprot:6983617-Prymnesium_polylepis.1
MCFCRASVVPRTLSGVVISLAPDREGRGFEPLRGRLCAVVCTEAWYWELQRSHLREEATPVEGRGGRHGGLAIAGDMGGHRRA